MSDGAHLGVGAERAVKTILGGEPDPVDAGEKQMTPPEMMSHLKAATLEDANTYDGCARNAGRLVLEYFLAHPEHAQLPASPSYARGETPPEAALAYAARGWHVFPVHGLTDDGACTCRRDDCSSQGKHPLVPHGLRDASCDPDVIRDWWTRWPHANVAIATGTVSGLVVIDIDLPDGEASIELVRDLGHHIPDTLSARTGSGGLHLLYTHPGWKVRNTARWLPGYPDKLDGVDVRGDGGYIVAAPSTHVSGGSYEWLPGPSEPAPWPTWMREPPPPERLLPSMPSIPVGGRGDTPYALKALDTEVRDVADAVQGTRNHQLNAAAFSLGQLVAGGELDEALVRAQLLIAAQVAGLGEKEARDTIQSGIKGGAQHPRKAPPRPDYVAHEYVPHPADTERDPTRDVEPVAQSNGHHDTPETPTVAAGPSTRTIRLIRDSQLADMPEPEWLVTDYLPAGGFVVLFGKPGSSKSFIALDLAYRITSGTPWFGGRAVTQGNVLYVVAEGVAGFKLRREAWKLKHPDADTDATWFAAGAVNLLEQREVTELVGVAGELESKLLVVDTLSRCMAGGDENSAKDTGLVVASLERVQQATGATVLLLHHTGWDATRERGSSNLRAVADASLELEAAGELMTLKVVKAKDSEPPPPLSLQRTTIELPGRVTRDGEPVTSCVVERAANTAGTALSGAAHAALEALLASDLGDGLTHSQWRDACSDTVPKSSFNRAIKELVGLTAVEQEGERRGARYKPVSPTMPTGDIGPEQGELL